MLVRNGESLPRRITASGMQDTELFLLSAETAEHLAEKAGKLAGEAAQWNASQFAEAARASACKAKKARRFRAAIVTGDPSRLSAAAAAVAADPLGRAPATHSFAFTGNGARAPRIVFAFPHTNHLPLLHADLWRERFWECRAAEAELAEHQDGTLPPRALAALRHLTAGYTGWRLMQRCNIVPGAIIGAGSGALLACAAAGVIDEEDLMPLAVSMAGNGSVTNCLSHVAFDDPLTPVYSAHTGMMVGSGCEARSMLAGLPETGSRLEHALAAASPDLLIEMGPGRGLAERAAELGLNSLSLETGNGQLACLLTGIAAAFAAGLPVNAAALYEDRRLSGETIRMESLRSIPPASHSGSATAHF